MHHGPMNDVEAGKKGKQQQHDKKARQFKTHPIESDMRRQIIIPSSLLLFTLSALEILFIHVAADSPQSTSSWTPEFWHRLRAGPNALLPVDKILFGSLILLAFELLDFLAKHSGQWVGSSSIPVRGKHLDNLTFKDLLFIGISKAQTPPFVYLYLRFAYLEPNVLWNAPTFSNVVLPLVPLFVVYDFFYTVLHWFLHIKAIYGFIHKHHHTQKAPSRANVDAVNVHPIEFFLGEYNHMLALSLTCRCVCQVHVIGSIVFLAVGGFLAGINHTRYDISFNVGGIKLYDSKAHDVHHRIPQSNYGQYIMLWDHLFGSYRPYNPSDRINPDAQLDPSSGKSVAYMKAMANSNEKK